MLEGLQWKIFEISTKGERTLSFQRVEKIVQFSVRGNWLEIEDIKATIRI